MMRNLTCFCAVFLLAGLICPPKGLASTKPAMAVVDFHSNGVSTPISSALSERLRQKMIALDRYRVLSLKEMQALVKTLARPSAPCPDGDQECLLKLGADLGIEFLVAGSLSKIGRYYFISLRLFDVRGKSAGLRHRVSERCECEPAQLDQTLSLLTTRLADEVAVAQPPPLKPVPIVKTEKTSAPHSVRAAGSIWTDPVSGLQFSWVPAGCVLMGSPASQKSRDTNEGPQHRVCIKGFWMGRHEVTNAQYRRFKSAHNSQTYEGSSLNDDQQPVVNVSWEDAVAFAQWLSRQAKTRFQLPTEAQWEYAARAGTTTPFFWGADAVDACTYANVADLTAHRRWPDWTVLACEDGMTVSSPPGRYQANPFGLYDMLGNVWEWCRDAYGPTPGSRLNNAQAMGLGNQKVYRGGSWNVRRRHLRVARRVQSPATLRTYNLGFRLVREN